MRQRQFHKLSKLSNLNISWKTLDQLAKNPPLGVVIAHEVLDALPVERIVLSKGGIYQQGVSLVEVDNKYCLDYINLNMPSYLLTFLEELSKETGVSIPPEGVKDGWSSELHENLSDWFEKISNQYKRKNQYY